MGYTNPLLVIHNRHKKTVTKYGYTHIFKNNLTYWTPAGMNDDHFSLMAAWYKYPTPILTCDIFRDHKYIDNNIIQWYEDMHMSYDRNAKITRNRYYSQTVQKNSYCYHLCSNNNEVFCINYKCIYPYHYVNDDEL